MSPVSHRKAKAHLRVRAVLALLLASLGTSLGGVTGIPAASAEVPADALLSERAFQDLLSEKAETSCRLARVNLLVGGFAKIDFGVLSLKVQPYVELRFNRR